MGGTASAAASTGLSRHPEQWAQVHGQPATAQFAFDEALRWESPVQTFFRTTSRDVEVAGVTIPEGTKVLLFLGSANRDPRHWGRTPTGSTSAGAPPGASPSAWASTSASGRPVARLESELVLTALARRARTLEPAGDPVPKPNNTLKRWAGVPVRVTPA